MNWALGFREAGWDVFLVESIASTECSHADGGPLSDQERFWHATVAEFGFEGRHCLLIDGKSPESQDFHDFASVADLFLNYAGHFSGLDLLPPGLCKGYVDVDPAFTQIWASEYDCNMHLSGHDMFFTVGLAMESGTARCPDLGLRWVSTPPPLPTESWRKMAALDEKTEGSSDAPWTTVGHWYGYKSVFWEGREYGGKRDSFLRLAVLPELVRDSAFAIASDLQPDWGDYDEFISAGWRMVSSKEVCADVPSYLRFLAASRGEVGIAKAGYLTSQCGWVSDRSLVYLSLGKPVVLQNTGWKEFLQPVGKGLLTFEGPEDCALRISEIEKDYATASKDALETAALCFGPEETVARIQRVCGV